jgi:2-polyprenyl-3-methyl-5-hydroxy-6-metoxy-1,4-benzoquinol methylase
MLDDYYEGVNEDLLNLLPRDARLVVEIGCAGGAMGRRYKLVNMHARYIGIESHGEAARVAAYRLDHVVHGDAEQLDATAIGIAPGTVDCLIYGDVLEHLRDPWTLLRRQAEWLRPGGMAVACIPNVQHWSVLVELLRGKWEYTSQGLLDRTHLRFFTLQSIRDLFVGAGLVQGNLLARMVPGPDFAQIQELLAPVLRWLQIDSSAFATQASAYQYLVQAFKPESQGQPEK